MLRRSRIAPVRIVTRTMNLITRIPVTPNLRASDLTACRLRRKHKQENDSTLLKKRKRIFNPRAFLQGFIFLRRTVEKNF